MVGDKRVNLEIQINVEELNNCGYFAFNQSEVSIALLLKLWPISYSSAKGILIKMMNFISANSRVEMLILLKWEGFIIYLVLNSIITPFNEI